MSWGWSKLKAWCQDRWIRCVHPKLNENLIYKIQQKRHLIKKIRGVPPKLRQKVIYKKPKIEHQDTNMVRRVSKPKLNQDRCLDKWIRGVKFPKLKYYYYNHEYHELFRDKWNTYNVRYDVKSERFYLKLSTLDVKEIRAKVWQRQNE